MPIRPDGNACRQCYKYPAGNVEHVMLMNEQYGGNQQGEPEQEGPTQPPRRDSCERQQQDEAPRDVQRGCEVVRQVESVNQGECLLVAGDRTETVKPQLLREEDEARPGEHCCERQPPAKCVDAGPPPWAGTFSNTMLQFRFSSSAGTGCARSGLME